MNNINIILGVVILVAIVKLIIFKKKLIKNFFILIYKKVSFTKIFFLLISLFFAYNSFKIIYQNIKELNGNQIFIAAILATGSIFVALFSLYNKRKQI